MYGGWKEMVVGVLLVVLLWKWWVVRGGCIAGGVAVEVV